MFPEGGRRSTLISAEPGTSSAVKTAQAGKRERDRSLLAADRAGNRCRAGPRRTSSGAASAGGTACFAGAASGGESTSAHTEGSSSPAEREPRDRMAACEGRTLDSGSAAERDDAVFGRRGRSFGGGRFGPASRLAPSQAAAKPDLAVVEQGAFVGRRSAASVPAHAGRSLRRRFSSKRLVRKLVCGVWKLPGVASESHAGSDRSLEIAQAAQQEGPPEQLGGSSNWVRGLDLNQRPSGYEPDELPGCSTLQRRAAKRANRDGFCQRAFY
jgi:hypothetical protein